MRAALELVPYSLLPDCRANGPRRREVLARRAENLRALLRLKELLRTKLIECGWRDELKEYCKGGRTARQPAPPRAPAPA